MGESFYGVRLTGFPAMLDILKIDNDYSGILW